MQRKKEKKINERHDKTTRTFGGQHSTPFHFAFGPFFFHFRSSSIVNTQFRVANGGRRVQWNPIWSSQSQQKQHQTRRTPGTGEAHLQKPSKTQ